MIRLKAPKKVREQRFVEQIRRLVPDFPPGALLPGETPDFRIDLGGELLGIEVTELPDPDRRAMESEWDSVLQEAEALATATLPPLDVAVAFKSGYRVRKSDRSEVAKALVAAVADRLPAFSEQSQILNTWRGPLPEQVHLVHLYRPERLDRHSWTALDGGMGNSECQSEIQGAVSRKASRLLTCLEECRRCWLLVVASGDEPSSFFDPGSTARAEVYSSRFERVFFLNAFSAQWFELSLRTE